MEVDTGDKESRRDVARPTPKNRSPVNMTSFRCFAITLGRSNSKVNGANLDQLILWIDGPLALLAK